MKNKYLKNLSWILSALIVFGLASCRKDNPSGFGFTPGKGAPTITSVHTFNKTDTAGGTKQVTTYDATGTATSTSAGTPAQVKPFDSTTVTGNPGQTYIIYGSNLGSATSITFNGTVAYFNRALITDQSIIVAIPSKTPTVGTAATNKLVITTLNGSVTYNFTVLPPPPTIVTESDFNFSSGSQITLTGQGFGAVTAVTLANGGAVATIVTKNDSVLVLKMPSVTISRSLLTFSYTSAAAAGKTLSTNSKVEFVDLDNNYLIFANGAYQNSWADNSWSGPSGASASAPSKSGKGGIIATYPAGGYKVEGMANYYPSIAYDPSYKYLSFWVKGGTADHTLFLVSDQGNGGYGNSLDAKSATAAQTILVPANVWTYYKIPLGSDVNQLAFWGQKPTTATVAKQLGFFLRGASGDVDETMYFDEVLFVK